LKNLIGISGKIGSGKDTVGHLVNQISSGYEIKKFAGKLKEVAGILTGVNPFLFEFDAFKTKMAPGYGMTYRQLLQRLGTEAIRKTLHPDAWVNALMSNYYGQRWIITDVRFPNEADAIRTAGGVVWRIERTTGGTTAADTHESETALDGYFFDAVIINNGTYDDLRTAIRAALVKK
jgi:hypothetical protein